MKRYEGIPPAFNSVIARKVRLLWASVKQRIEQEKAPEELKPYFKELRICNLFPEDTEKAQEVLGEILETNLGMLGYLDVAWFDPQDIYNYDELPRRRVSTLVAGEWREPLSKVEESEVFPKGGGQKDYSKWKRPRDKHITKALILEEVVQEVRGDLVRVNAGEKPRREGDGSGKFPILERIRSWGSTGE